MGKERVHVFVHGLVQGVFFRATTHEKAMAIGLTGWVRNRPDGTVEIVAEGDKEKLEKLVEWCWVGPKEARVTDVETTWKPYLGEFGKFSIGYRDR